MENVISSTSVEDVSLKPADNGGFIVKYCQRTKATNPSMNSDYQYKEEVFEDGNKALSRMQELLGIEAKKAEQPEQAKSEY